jgi:POT family proton-dependent oligopeptide transporter
MQGGWLAATAIGMNLVGVVGYLWMRVPLSALWMILVVACVLSATFMFAVLKKLEKATCA